jgi:hypothetical protein
MKPMTCLECGAAYDESFGFCLADGARLRDNRMNQPASPASGYPNAACGKCGSSNKEGATFCKRCGNALPLEQAPSRMVVPVTQPQTIVMDHEVPEHAGMFAATASHKSPASIIFGTIGMLLFAGLVGVLAYNVGSRGGAANTNLVSSNTSNVSTSNANANMRATPTPYKALSNSTTTSDPLIGRTGVLTTDVNLRESPHRTSSKMGTHYQGARIRILDTAEVPNDEGGTSTWYRVTVTSYGTSQDPNNYGLGKNPGSADEGWMNSNPKVWDNFARAELHKRTVDLDSN